jgi:hypothetical protein
MRPTFKFHLPLEFIIVDQHFKVWASFWRAGIYGDRGGTVLQIGRSLVRFQMVSLEFFIHIFLPIALLPWGRLSL